MSWSKLLLLATFILLIALARKPQPAKAISGDRFFGAAPSQDDDQIMVASYNIQTGKSLEGKRNIQASAAVLADADLAGVQEVYAAGWFNKFGVGQSQPEVLAGDHFAYRHHPTRWRWGRTDRGNAILSKLAVKAWHTLG